MANPQKVLREQQRQALTQDAKYLERGVYFFELQVPFQLASGFESNVFTFPLVIPPESYRLEEPFAVQPTTTLGGGLYVEENGIVMRTIHIEGHTGFKPRPVPGKKQASGLAILAPSKRSFGRQLSPQILDEISGQRHFQYLQDAVFRVYADLKRDPATAKETRLIFHNPKDEEHWIVVPKRFELSRSIGNKKFLYQYSIELLIVDTAQDANVDFSEDKEWIDALKDNIRRVKAGIDMVSGAIQTLTALVAEVKNFVSNFAKIIDSVTAIIDAASDFVDGVVDFIRLPLNFISSIKDLVDESLQTFENIRNASTEIRDLPEEVIQMIRTLGDGLDLIDANPTVFESPAQARMREIKDRQQLGTSVTSETFTARAATPAETTLQAISGLGTGLMAGDETISKADFGVGKNPTAYTSVQQYTIQKGDSLVSLAQRYLGDARLWQHIAITNNLKPPFIDDQARSDLGETDNPALPGVTGIGRTILIPTFSQPIQELPLLPVLGVRPEEPPANHLLGSDFKLVKNTAGQMDIAIDTDHGSVDAQAVSGIPNIQQALITRLETERGTDLLFREVGVGRVVGLGIKPLDLELARFRHRQALKADPRIAAVRRLELEQDTASPDAVIVDADLEVRGFSQPNNIRSTAQVVM